MVLAVKIVVVIFREKYIGLYSEKRCYIYILGKMMLFVITDSTCAKITLSNGACAGACVLNANATNSGQTLTDDFC